MHVAFTPIYIYRERERNSWQVKRLCDRPCWMRRWIRKLRHSCFFGRRLKARRFPGFWGRSGKCMKSWVSVELLFTTLHFGAPAFRVKIKTFQKISKASHDLPSMSLLSRPRWDWKPWTISQSSQSFATSPLAWSTSEGLAGCQAPRKENPRCLALLSDTSSWPTQSTSWWSKGALNTSWIPCTFLWHVWDLLFSLFFLVSNYDLSLKKCWSAGGVHSGHQSWAWIVR